MSTIPKKKSEQLGFFESHWPVWNVTPADIGLTSTQVQAFKTLTQTARASFDAAETARNAAKAATLQQDSDLNLAYTSCSDLIRVIRGFAEQQANPDAVYSAANIPAPQPPLPAPAPGTPANFTVALLQNGAVELSWKCANPEGTQGTIYEVRRKTGSGAFTFIGAIGVKKFVDDTLVAGSTNVVYQITAVRSTVRGNPAQFNVNFGIGGDGFMVASVKLAA